MNVGTLLTLTNYVSSGVLPAPTRFGRDVGWSVDVLRGVLEVVQGPLNALPESKKTRLQQALEFMVSPVVLVVDDEGECGVTNAIEIFSRLLPEPILVDGSGNPEYDLRRYHLEKLNVHMGLMDIAASESRDAKNGSPESKRLWDEVASMRLDVDLLKNFLRENFIHLHSNLQLLGFRELFTWPLFNARNKKWPRQEFIKLYLKLIDGTDVIYEGPELRQEDGLVFMSLLNIARDVRVGKAVGITPKDICISLWGYYSGPARNKLWKIISRLQGGILRFPDFRVQLVQRFDFPKGGEWFVELDKDIVKMLTKNTVVWLDLEDRLSLSSGLASWLYAYIRSQSTLIPTKVERLRQLCGSEGALDGFRESLRNAMDVLAGAQHVDVGWSIDKHDQLRWRKIPKAV